MENAGLESMHPTMQQTEKERAEYSIGELASEFDVTPRTLRFYEQKGLLHPARRGWTRLFSYRDRARLQLILRGKKVGFALEEIKEMLDLYNLRDGQLTQLRIASTKMRERLEALRKQRVFDVGCGNGGDEVAIESRDDGGRRFRRRENAEPQRHFVTAQSGFNDRWRIG